MTSTSKAVTPFAGLSSFIAWLRQTGFLDQAARALPFSYASPNAIPVAHTFTAFLLSVVVGASPLGCGFFDQALLAMLEEHAMPCIIVARMTTALRRRLHSSALVWREAPSLDTQGIQAPGANRVAFTPSPPASRGLGSRDTRQMRDLNPLKRLQSNGKSGVRVERALEARHRRMTAA